MTTGSLTRRMVSFTVPRLLSLRVLVATLLVVLVAAGGWLWFRSSSFASVRQVTVTGLSGPSVEQIRAALEQAATTMSTLHMNVQKLDVAVAGYPEVRTLSVSTHFPHAAAIHVYEQVPVATISVGGQSEVVDGSGDVLQQSMQHGTLPQVPLKAAPDGTSVTAPGGRAALAVLAAAPYSFLGRIESATSSHAHGVIVTLRDGPQIYFGTRTQLRQKWTSTLATLASPDSHGAAYIDVSDPVRPAAGAGAIAPPPSTDTGTITTQ
jgi:cell division septal protein FtsQ